MEGEPFDISFYTELRYPDPAETILARYASATRRLVSTLAADLRSEERGEFGGGNERVMAAIAVAADRVAGHVDEIEATLVAESVDPERDRMLRNVVANVVADTNFADVAEAHVLTPQQFEAKFKVGEAGAILDKSSDLGAKLKTLAELIPVIGEKLNKVAALLEELGLVGKYAFDVSGGDEVGKQLEQKLDAMFPRLDGLQAGQQALAPAVQGASATLDQTRREVFKIEQKADLLADLLGQTLVGEGWIVDPLRTRDRPNMVPEKDVKEELHDLEDLLNVIINLLGPVTDDPVPPENGDLFDRPVQDPDVGVPVLEDWRLKKIYVYAENVFAPASANDRRNVRIRTPAFEVSGWLDLSRLRSGDEFEAQIRVSLAGRQNVLFSRRRFDQPGLKPLSDFAKGLNTLPGTDVRITLRQTASADDFATPVEVAYQFVVESQ